MEHWAKKIFRKNYPKTSSKHVWTLLGTILGIFGILKLFWFFWKFSFGHFWGRFWAFLELWKLFDFFLQNSEDSTLQGTLGKNFFRENHPKTCSKHVWTLWNDLGFFGILKSFLTVKTFRLDTFGDDFGHFWNFETFLIFLKIFEDSTLHGTLGKKFFRKNHPKTSSKHVWTLLGRIWAFLEFWKFFDFFENFRRLDPPSNTGQKFF